MLGATSDIGAAAEYARWSLASGRYAPCAVDASENKKASNEAFFIFPILDRD
jgi:hypothetical protein